MLERFTSKVRQNFGADPRKKFNAGISLALWLASFLLFGLQRQIDSNEVQKSWAQLRITVSRQIEMLAHGADMDYVRRDVLRTIEQFCELRASESKALSEWVSTNVTQSLASLSSDDIYGEVGNLKPLLSRSLELQQPSYARSPSVVAWCICALLYFSVEILIYGLFPTPARLVEASLSVLHVGFIGTALEISGGLISHFSWIWLIFFALHSLLVVGQGLGRAAEHGLARHAPYLVAIPFGLFWATFDGNWSAAFWMYLAAAVMIVYLFLVAGLLYARRPEAVPAATAA